MADTAIDLAKARQAAQRVDKAAGVIRGLQVRIQGHKDHLRSGWDSTAARSFDDVFSHFDADFTRVLKALDTLHENLNQGTRTYEKSVADQQAAVNKVNQLLNGQT